MDSDEELNTAAWAAMRGAVVGAAKWGIFAAIAGALAYKFSPVYRGITIQFKVFLQMSGMVTGSMIEADRRLRWHEELVRRQKRMAADAEMWRRYQQDYVNEAAEAQLRDSEK